MTTCFEAGLAAREFGTHILHVHDLLDWAKSKRLHLRTTPPIDGYEFVHIETLLCAIERHATNLTHAQALLIVKNDPALQARMVAGMGIEQEEFDRYLTESPAWLVQADAHSQWRKTFAAAIKAGELLPLEFGSKLPIVTAPEQSPATPAPDVAVIEAMPDPERRLTLLRELGGTAKYTRCDWKFTGIKELVDHEKANGRKRSTDKTIRADLKEAAQNERDAKRAGFSDGLGQR